MSVSCYFICKENSHKTMYCTSLYTSSTETKQLREYSSPELHPYLSAVPVSADTSVQPERAICNFHISIHRTRCLLGKDLPRKTLQPRFSTIPFPASYKVLTLPIRELLRVAESGQPDVGHHVTKLMK